MFLPKPRSSARTTGSEFRQQVERAIKDVGFVKTPPRGDEQYVSVAQGCFITIKRSGFGNSPAGGAPLVGTEYTLVEAELGKLSCRRDDFVIPTTGEFSRAGDG